MSKPSILLITGSFGLPEFYDDVVNPVAAKGYEIRALHSPSVGLKTGPRPGAPPSMYDDAAFIAKETEKLADEGKDVLLIAHSYGGVPTTQSTKGLSKEERSRLGKKGGVVKLAYVTCLVPPVGTNAAGLLTDIPAENRVDLKIDVRSFVLPGSRRDPLTP
jgi:pimeloyl-ACP methyl ester carboxylesterase